MRFKVVRRRKGEREMVVRLQRGEALDMRRLESLRRWSHKNFLALSYDVRGDAARASVRYEISGLTCVSAYLKRRLTGAELARLLVNLAEALAWCVSSGQRMGSVVYDADRAFVNRIGTLRLACVPLKATAMPSASSPLTLLRAFGGIRRSRLADPLGIALANRVAAYVLAAENTFSINDYRAFVAAECHVLVRADGTIGSSAQQDGRTRGEAAPPIDAYAASPDVVATHLVGAPAAYCLLRMATNESFALAAGVEVVVGRGAACGIQLSANPKISRRHAAITCEELALVVRDLGSANGTLVDGAAVVGFVRLAYGQQFLLADEAFVVVRFEQAVQYSRTPTKRLPASVQACFIKKQKTAS